MKIYERYGYKTVIVSKDTVRNRRQFIINRIKADKALIRKMLPAEYSLLEDIMYEAIYHPDPANPYPQEVIYYPQVRVYWDNWGTEKDDHCLMAIVDSQVAGAVWIRTFQGELKGCGYIDESTLEIAIALFEPYRNQGIGTRMMEQMVELMKAEGYAQVSLSITKGNPAIRLYMRLGFTVIDENEEDYIMLLHLEHF
jgi:ribosomal protein S18 acetylase RimI-like enzyme